MDAVKDKALDFLFTKAAPDAHPLSCNAFIIGLALFYFVLFHVTYIPKWTEPKDAEFVDHPRAEWHNSIGSLISAIAVVVVTLPGLADAWGYTELGCYFGYALWQDLGARCFVAFLLHDFFNLLMYYPLSETPTKLMLLHHFIFAIPCLYALSGSYFRFQSLWLLAGEASNIFLNFKIMMAAAGYKGTWYLLNGMVFTIVFGTVRVGFYGYGLWHLYQTRYIWTSSVAPRGMREIVYMFFAGYGLQLYWFYYTLNMLKRAVWRAKSKNDKSE